MKHIRQGMFEDNKGITKSRILKKDNTMEKVLRKEWKTNYQVIRPNVLVLTLFNGTLMISCIWTGSQRTI